MTKPCDADKPFVRPFAGTDTDAILRCWNASLPLDGIVLDDLERKVLLDPSYEPDGFLVAELEWEVVGFIVCFVLRRPIEKTGYQDDRGFITAFGVDPSARGKGVGSALLAAAESFFRARNRKLITLAPYTPGYFVPGVDKDNYPEGLAFLQENGFVEYSEALAADALISKFQLTPEVLAKEESLRQQGITIRHYRRHDLAAYLQFQREHMPGPWVEDARRNLVDLSHGRFPEDAIWLAVHQQGNAPERIVGFCQNEHEHFGPFGVTEEFQGTGIGTVLLARTLYQMRLRGCHSAWVLWTGRRALDGIYGRLGFKLTRRFAIMKKELT